MAVNLLIRKYIDVIDDFATTDANGSMSYHSCLKFTAYMIKLVSQSVNSFVDFSRRLDVYLYVLQILYIYMYFCIRGIFKF